MTGTSSMNWRRWIALASATIAIAGAPAPSRAGFTIRDLGAIASSGTSGAEAINATGQAAGMVTSPGGSPVAARSIGTGGLQAISIPSGAASSLAMSINSGGDVAGSYMDANGVRHGFFTSGGSTSTIGPLVVNGQSGTFTQANGINAGGTVVGTGDIPGGADRAFVSAGGGTPTIIKPLDAGGFDQGNGINDAGTVVGTSETSPGGLQHAFFTDKSGAAVDLLSRNAPGNFNFNTYGTAIDQAGDIAGYGDVGGSEHAFFAAASGGALCDLGVLPGASSSLADAVNSMALVVGQSGIGFGQSGSRAFLWGGPEGMYDLNSLISKGDEANWLLTQATGINDLDQISGVGYIDGVLHGFVLTPVAGESIFVQPGAVPAPPALLLSGLGMAMASAWSRRRAGLRPGRTGGRAGA